jgi:hypothetical protein
MFDNLGVAQESIHQTDTGEAKVMNIGGDMVDNVVNNEELTKYFIEKYRAEIEALVADCDMRDIYIGISTEGPWDYPTMAQYYVVDEPEEGHAIGLNWDYILEAGDMRLGLLVFAYHLRAIWQVEKGPLVHWDGMAFRDQYEREAMDYAYEAVQRLFQLYQAQETLPELHVR